MEVNKLELRRVLKNFNLLNCLLVAAALVFTISFLLPQRDSNLAIVLPSLKKKPVEKTQNEPTKGTEPFSHGLCGGGRRKPLPSGKKDPP